jgi:NTP pyrophosphatase (non-canonical NTP hydrolase)
MTTQERLKLILELASKGYKLHKAIEEGLNLTIKQLVKEAYKNAKAKGFWEDWEEIEQTKIGDEETYRQLKNNAIGNRLMLIVSELGEAEEALRHNDIDNFKEELADVAIRLADLCGGLNIDLEDEIRKKMERNKKRPYKHGKQF